MDHTNERDPLDQLQDENTVDQEEFEQGADTAPVTPSEESAINSDTEVAEEATEATAREEVDPELEEEAKLVDEAVERKHKNRESTSEKAKKAAATREKKGLAAEPVSSKKLDPLRLRGKKYRAKASLVDKNKFYEPEEALALVKETSTTSFDGAVEVHAKVKTEGVRGMVTLPHGTGKSKKVAVADDATLEQIAAGKLDFDVLLATPAQMPKLAKYAKVLGPKGLMPSPKAGTVTEDVEKAREEISGGRIEYRADKNGVVHTAIGRISFSAEQLLENFKALEHVLVSAKIEALSIASTMGPGIKISLTK